MGRSSSSGVGEPIVAMDLPMRLTMQCETDSLGFETTEPYSRRCGLLC